MRSDKLQDAVGMVDNDLLERAEQAKKKKAKRIIKWTVPVAAMLALAIGLTVFFPRGGTEIRAHAAKAAEYPVMAQRPEDLKDYDTETLKEFNTRRKAWKNDREKQLAFCGAGEGLEGFFSATISEFLSGDGENRIYSPLNVYMALSMLAEITDGNTRQEILMLIGARDIESLRKQAHDVWNANYFDDGTVTSILASSLWLGDDMTYKSETLDILAESYYASTFQGKMGSEEYNELLRDWLNEQTKGLLSKHTSKEKFDVATTAAIATTVYFRAKWEDRFEKDLTTEKVFHADSGDITCEFLNGREMENYAWGEKFTAASRALENSGNMWFILPDEGVSVRELLKNNEALSFMASPDDFENQKELEVNLSVPKFDVDSRFDLIKGLKRLGLSDCFNWFTSDFTPLTDKGGIEVEKANHAARVKIDEEGVEAAAYTLIGMLQSSAVIPDDKIDFIVDRPFIFVVTGSDGLPLFVGTVNEL